MKEKNDKTNFRKWEKDKKEKEKIKTSKEKTTKWQKHRKKLTNSRSAVRSQISFLGSVDKNLYPAGVL